MINKSIAIMHNDFVDAYLQLTGLETGYGFFGYNVRSSGSLYFNLGKTEISPFFIDYESTNRFATMVSVITDPYLKDTSSSQAQVHKNSEIMMRNMALKMLSAKKITQFNTIKVIYKILEFPTLKNYRINRGEFHETDLFEINYLKEANVH